MFPFDYFKDDRPEWVVARDKRYDMLEKLILENVPDIVKFDNYSYRCGTPIKSKYVCIYELRDRCILEHTQWYLSVHRYWSGVSLNIIEVNRSAYKGRNGYEYDHMTEREYSHDLYWREDSLEEWKAELAKYLPGFFEAARKDVGWTLNAIENGKKAEKIRAKVSVEKTEGIINCLRNKLKRNI